MISLAMPNLDQGRFLAEALDSVFAQTGVELHVALLDGGSQDDSLAVIRRYEARLTYWRSHPDRGQAAAINEGIDHLGQSDYVGWLNADDRLLPEGLHRLVEYLQEHPECVAVFGKAYISDDEGHVIDEYPSRPFDRKSFAKTCTICQPASLIRYHAWRTAGGLDETLYMCLDYDLWWRLSKAGRIGFLDTFVACSRDHEATKTRTQRDRLYQEAFEVVRRHLGYIPWRWCLSRTAYEWRAAHGGARATSLASQGLCAWRALNRYGRVNRLSGLMTAMNSLRGAPRT